MKASELRSAINLDYLFSGDFKRYLDSKGERELSEFTARWQGATEDEIANFPVDEVTLDIYKFGPEDIANKALTIFVDWSAARRAASKHYETTGDLLGSERRRENAKLRANRATVELLEAYAKTLKVPA